MIKILHHAPGRFAPVMICDTCGKRIEDPQLAAAVTSSLEIPEGGLAEVFHVHKGECHDKAEARLSGGRPGWVELTRHLYLLTQNLGMSAAAFEAAEENAKDLESLFPRQEPSPENN